MSKLSKRLHKNMWSIHNWVGIYAGVIIAFLSITGVVALFKVEIEELVNHDLHFIKNKTDVKKDLADIRPLIDSLKHVYGNKNVFSMEVPRSDDETLTVRVLENKSFFDYKSWDIFVNPYTGKVIQKRDNFRSIEYFIRNIHVRFYDGLFGRYIVGFAGIALLISTITGFWIYGNFLRKDLNPPIFVQCPRMV